MNILVLIKQVPDTSEVKMDEETGTMIREGVGTIINPLDLNALEAALALKEAHGGKVTVMSMGPPQAVEAIREAIAMGADEGVLLSARQFAGSDTLATSYALSAAIKRLARDACAAGGHVMDALPDLILAGERAIDGETGQVGPEVATMLGIPFITYVSRIEDISPGAIKVRRIVEDGYEIVESPLPALITVVKEINEPRMPTLRGKVKAKAGEVPTWGPGQVDVDLTRVGLSGSPTRVVKVFYPKVTRDGIILKTSEHSPEECVDALIEFLDSRGALEAAKQAAVPIPEPTGNDAVGVPMITGVSMDTIGVPTTVAGIEMTFSPGAAVGGATAAPEDESISVQREPVLDRDAARGVWVLAECRSGQLQPVTYELLNKGRELADKLGAYGERASAGKRGSHLGCKAYLGCVILGHQVLGNPIAQADGILGHQIGSGLGYQAGSTLGHQASNAKEAILAREAIYRGADKVFVVDAPGLEHFAVEPYLNSLEFLIKKYSPEIIIAGATTTGRTLMPALAARLKTGLTADCTGLDIAEDSGLLLQTRPAIGGNVMATIKTPASRPEMATFRPKTVKPAARDTSRRGELIVESIPREFLQSRVRFLKSIKGDAAQLNIQESDIVISGGRGLTRADNFRLLRELAALMNAALGASRACVDQGWIAYPHQVGLSGKTVSPKLYMAFGISGSVQHIAGMQTSEIIVAVNKDPDAPIFKVADFGIVGNLFEVLPILIERLRAREAQDARTAQAVQDVGEAQDSAVRAAAPTVEKSAAGVGLPGPQGAAGRQHGQEAQCVQDASGHAAGAAGRYNRVTDDIVRELESIVGEHFVTSDPEKLETYACDESMSSPTYMPEVVVKPKDAHEISAILKLACKRRVPVTPRGAGTGLSGGAVPVYGGIVLSLERMNRILELDEKNLMMTVEPGVITNEVQRVAASRGFLYAGDPCSSESSFIGGNVAENAGGNKAIKYGTTARHVYGLEVVLPTGEITFFGGKRVKDVTGYDFIHLLVGSEGTLGIVTKIMLKLIPLPKYRASILVPFDSVETAIGMVPKIMSERRIVPTSIEFMDRPSVELTEEYLNMKLPYDEASAHLIIEIDGNNKADVEAEYEAIGQMCLDNGALEVFVADNKNTLEKVWKARKAIAEAVKALSKEFCMEDIVVPISEIPGMLREIARISDEFRLKTISFGHAGDGNIHVTFLKDEESAPRWERDLPLALRELYRATISLGGTISGEHGIGFKRKEYIGMAMDEVQLELIRRIKRAFDPDLILNPGKIVDAHVAAAAPSKG